MDLNLWWQIFLHFLFYPSEHEGSQDLVKLMNDLSVSFFLFLVRHTCVSVSTKIKPLIEFL